MRERKLFAKGRTFQPMVDVEKGLSRCCRSATLCHLVRFFFWLLRLSWYVNLINFSSMSLSNATSSFHHLIKLYSELECLSTSTTTNDVWQLVNSADVTIFFLLLFLELSFSACLSRRVARWHLSDFESINIFHLIIPNVRVCVFKTIFANKQIISEDFFT